MDDAMNASNTARYTSETYALSGKIMLSAIIILFTVVILIICLHIYARWFLSRARRHHHHDIRRRRRLPHTRIIFTADLSPTSAATAAASRGLHPSVLKSLPTYAFSSAANPDGLECAVCLCEFEENEKARLLPKCNHSFHIECIDMWFHSHSTCPLCRVPVSNSDVIAELVGQNSVQIVVDSGEVGPGVSSNAGAEMMAHDASGSAIATASSSGSGSGSVGSRRKGFELVGISIEVPRRAESFKGVEEEVHGSPGCQGGFRTPGGRILSFKRILSREKRVSTPLSCSGSAVEREEEATEQEKSQASTPNGLKA